MRVVPFFLLLLVGLLAVAAGAQAATLTVTSEADSGDGSLRNVLENATDDANSITFAEDVHVIETASKLVIEHNVTIDGDWQVTIQKQPGSGKFFGIQVDADVAVHDLWIRNFTLHGAQVNAGHTLTSHANFTGNSALNGGAVFVDGHFLNEGTIFDNTADDHGGGVYVSGGSFTNHGNVTDNTAIDNGGGVFVSGGSFTNHGNVTGNTAERGGGVFVYGGSFTNDGNVTDNTATDGGGVYMFGGSFTNHGNVTGNTAGLDGGGVYVSGGSFTNRGSINDNDAAFGNGGGVHVRSGAPWFNITGTITGNHASGYGGGIFAERSGSIYQAVIHNNTANGDFNNIRPGGSAPTQADASSPTNGTLNVHGSAPAANTSFRIDVFAATNCDGGVGGVGSTEWITSTLMTSNSTGTYDHNFTSLAGGTYTTQFHELSNGAIDRSHLYSDCVTLLPNQAPSATAAILSVTEDTAQGSQLVGTDPDQGQSIQSFALASGPSHGLVDLTTGTGEFTYTPTTDYAGGDSFTFTVNDGDVDSDSAIVSITVDNVNDAPVATAGVLAVTEDVDKEAQLNGSDVDNGDVLEYAITSQPSHGTIELDTATGGYTYSPAENFTGSDSFTFTVNDGDLDSASATVSITVAAVNDAPVATAGTLAVTKNVAKEGQLAGTDIDPGDAVVSYAVVDAPSNGTVDLNTTHGNYTYTPETDFTGTVSFNFTVNDGELDSAPAKITITVSEAPPPTNDGGGGGGGGGGAAGAPSAVQGDGTAASPTIAQVTPDAPVSFTAGDTEVTISLGEGAESVQATFYEIPAADAGDHGFTAAGYSFDLDIQGLQAGDEAMVSIAIPADQLPEGETFQLEHAGPDGIEVVEASFEVTPDGLVVTFDAGQLESFSPFHVSPAAVAPPAGQGSDGLPTDGGTVTITDAPYFWPGIILLAGGIVFGAWKVVPRLRRGHEGGASPRDTRPERPSRQDAREQAKEEKVAKQRERIEAKDAARQRSIEEREEAKETRDAERRAKQQAKIAAQEAAKKAREDARLQGIREQEQAAEAAREAKEAERQEKLAAKEAARRAIMEAKEQKLKEREEAYAQAVREREQAKETREAERRAKKQAKADAKREAAEAKQRLRDERRKQAERCTATTKAGTQCSNRAKSLGGHCAVHDKSEQAQAVLNGRCQAMTPLGLPCAEASRPGKPYCKRHKRYRR